MAQAVGTAAASSVAVPRDVAAQLQGMVQDDVVKEFAKLLSRTWPKDFIMYPAEPQGPLCFLTAITRDEALREVATLITRCAYSGPQIEVVLSKLALHNQHVFADQAAQIVWIQRLAKNWRALQLDITAQVSET